MIIFPFNRAAGLKTLKKAASVRLDTSAAKEEEEKSHFGMEFSLFLFVFFIVSVVIVAVVAVVLKTANLEDRQEAWIANGCPVYKSECGEKHPYACEKKAAAVGKVDIGYALVEAYPTCQVKQKSNQP